VTLEDAGSSEEQAAGRRIAAALDASTIDALLADAQASGTPIDGADGLLNRMTQAVLERALQTEMTHHLGYAKDDPAGVGSGNSRNGSSTKTVSTTNGPVTITVPRDRNGEFEPRIVPKRARRVGQIDELILSLYARGLSTRDIAAHLAEVYGVNASRELISNVTDVVTDEIELWRNRPVEEVYPIVVHRRHPDPGPGQGRGHDQGRAPGHRGRRRRAQARPGLLDHRGRGRQVLARRPDPATQSGPA
jgi:putative transposase